MSDGLSGKNLDVRDIFVQHDDLAAAARLYFSPSNPDYQTLFFGLPADDVERRYQATVNELSQNYSLSVLAAVEAAFRVDYILRVRLRKKDEVSRALRKLHRRKARKASLEDDILQVWKEHTDPPTIIGHMVGAFNFRHWLAHGRYWIPKFGRTYDFYSVYELAMQLLSALPLEGMEPIDAA